MTTETRRRALTDKTNTPAKLSSMIVTANLSVTINCLTNLVLRNKDANMHHVMMRLALYQLHLYDLYER